MGSPRTASSSARPGRRLGALVYLVPEPQLRPFLQEDVGVEGRLLGGFLTELLCVPGTGTQGPFRGAAGGAGPHFPSPGLGQEEANSEAQGSVALGPGATRPALGSQPAPRAPPPPEPQTQPHAG